MSDTPIYDRLKMEFLEPGQPPAREDLAQEQIDEEALGDPDVEYDRKVDEELNNE